MLRRSIALGLLFATLASAGLLAQARWHAPYDKGVKALAAGKWQEAITNLEQAIKIEPKAQASKVFEGVFRVDYFPYFYLGQAYLAAGRFEDAEQALKTASETKMSAPLTRDLEDAQRQVAAALKPKPTPPPPPTATPPRPTATPPTNTPPPPPVTPTPTPTPTNTPTPTATPVRPVDPPKPTVAPGFAAALTTAENALRIARYSEAVTSFTRLRELDAAEFNRLGLGAKLDEASRGKRATELVQEGQLRLKDEKYTDAKARFIEANALVPGIAKNGIAQIDSRDADYRQFVTQGDQFRDARRLADALKSYELAEQAQSERYRAENVAVRVDAVKRAVDLEAEKAEAIRMVKNGVSLAKQQHKYADALAAWEAALKKDPANHDAANYIENASNYENFKKAGLDYFQKGDYAAARPNLLDAKDIDKDRFEFEGLGRHLTDIDAKLKVVPAPVNPFASAINDALVAYLSGEVDRAISLLEPAAAGDKDLEPQSKADVHAYLGVAYADRAFALRDQAERNRFRDKALAEFRLALASAPSYQLSNRLGPKVQDLLAEARRR